MDKSTTCSKRVKLLKKRLDDSHTINRVPVPRKLRSALKNRYSDPSSSNLTKDEKEAVAGLLALGGNDNSHEINLNIKHLEATSSKTEDLVQNDMQIDDPNESRNGLDVKKESLKRCSTHVYICRIIKNLKNAKGKAVNQPIEAKTETTTENVTNVNVGIVLFDDQSSGYEVHSYFGNPFCDPSQWSRPVFPKQQMWMNQFMYKQPQLGSYLQASFHNVLGSKQQQQQQLPFKMHFDHLPSSRHDENGVLFCVDGPPTLKLALQ